MAKIAQKQNFLGGVAVLAAAVVAVKLISALYKIPLGNILDDEGMGHFNIAYNVYNFLLQLSTAGFPLALSKLTSEAGTLGRYNQVRRQFRVAAMLFFGLGAAGAAVMFFCAAPLASLLNDSLAYYPIRVLAPAVFFVCLIGCCRGYTQGLGNMVPTAASQILEALCKLVIGLGLSWYVLRKLSVSVEIGAAAAIFGVTIGAAAAVLFLVAWLARHRTRTVSHDVPEGRRAILKKLLMTGVPITLGASVMSIITVTNQIVVTGRLQEVLAAGGMALSQVEKAATELYGQYTFGLTLFNLPVTFVPPITVSLIPAVTAALTQHNHERANHLISASFRLVALLALPAGVGLSVLAGPILQLLYPSVPETAAAAAYHLQVLGIAVIFTCLMMLTNGILQACGRVDIPIFTAVAGGIVNVAVAWTLCGQPEIGVKGAPISTLSGYVVIAALNMIAVAWVLGKHRPRYGKLFFKPALATALMGLSAYYSFNLLAGPLGLSPKLSVLAAILLAVVVYGVLALALRMITRQDLLLLPKGEKIAKWLHIDR